MLGQRVKVTSFSTHWNSQLLATSWSHVSLASKLFVIVTVIVINVTIDNILPQIYITKPHYLSFISSLSSLYSQLPHLGCTDNHGCYNYRCQSSNVVQRMLWLIHSNYNTTDVMTTSNSTTSTIWVPTFFILIFERKKSYRTQNKQHYLKRPDSCFPFWTFSKIVHQVKKSFCIIWNF